MGRLSFFRGQAQTPDPFLVAGGALAHVLSPVNASVRGKKELTGVGEAGAMAWHSPPGTTLAFQGSQLPRPGLECKYKGAGPWETVWL